MTGFDIHDMFQRKLDKLTLITMLYHIKAWSLSDYQNLIKGNSYQY